MRVQRAPDGLLGAGFLHPSQLNRAARPSGQPPGPSVTLQVLCRCSATAPGPSKASAWVHVMPGPHASDYRAKRPELSSVCAPTQSELCTHHEGRLEAWYQRDWQAK